MQKRKTKKIFIYFFKEKKKGSKLRNEKRARKPIRLHELKLCDFINKPY